MKFFVAKVDPKKVQFVDGRAELSPLRFHYDTQDFVLPIRLGLANSSGTQDLIVNILAPGQRYEVANYKNVTIPTNIDVKDDVKERFGSFYAALFDRTVEKNPGAVVTEYAWQATTCDPCPGPALNYHDFMTLGADVITSTEEDDMPRPKGRGMRPPIGGGGNFVLTRLHARYGKDIKDDLVFKAAPPIVGGREFVVDETTHKLEEGSKPADTNNFQGRYAIRHPWTGEVKCDKPQRGIWGGPNGGSPQTKPALDLAFAPRGQVQLAAAIVPQDVPEIGMKGGVLEQYAPPPMAPQTSAPAPPDYKPPKSERGCGCQTSDPAGLLPVLGVLLIFRPGMRRRRRKGA
jgi:MYXO-CTERM domain-containing protein